MTHDLTKLTPRQTEILELVAKGFTNIEIGELLDVSAGTVKVHISSIIERLDVTNRTEAATIWLRERLSNYLLSASRARQSGASACVCLLPFSYQGVKEESGHFAHWAWSDIRDVLTKNGVEIVDGQTAAAISQAGIAEDTIRDNLGAAYVVKCSISENDDAPVVSVDCRDTRVSESVFSGVYEIDAQSPDISFLDIAIDLLKYLKVESGAVEAAETKDGKEALERFWRGQHCFSQRTPASLLKSCEHFQAAINADPKFIGAYVGLANAAHQIGYYGEAAQGYFYEMGRMAAQRAVELGRHSAPAHSALAYSQFVADWNFSEARRSFERARHLDPEYDAALMWYSLLSMVVGDFEKSLALAEEGLSKNPMAIPHFVHIGHVYRSQGRLEDAIAHLNIAVEMDPAHIRANIWLALTHADIGDFDVATQYIQRMIAANGRVSTLLGIAGYIAGLRGDKKACARLVDEIRSLPGADSFAALYIAFCQIGAGETELAYQWIWKALDQRPPLVLGWRCDPIFARLRDHGEFDSVANTIGLPDVA